MRNLDPIDHCYIIDHESERAAEAADWIEERFEEMTLEEIVDYLDFDGWEEVDRGELYDMCKKELAKDYDRYYRYRSWEEEAYEGLA